MISPVVKKISTIYIEYGFINTKSDEQFYYIAIFDEKDISIKLHCSFIKILHLNIQITHHFSSLGLNDKSIKLAH